VGQYKPLMQRVGGVFFVSMGLFMLGIIKPAFLYIERRIELPKNITKWKKLNSLLVGMTFGFAWTPCIGPVLAVILFWASQTQNFIQGISLLLVYGIGLGLPFLVVALLFESISLKLSKATKLGHVLQILSAVIIIIMGILLFLGKIEIVSVKLLQLFNLNTLSV
jgi:cytochrome c-type biogenesis protein